MGRHKRQFLLFLTAILLPAAVLVGLAVRVVRQDRELAQKRASDDRNRELEQISRELAARLEAIKLQEINRLMPHQNPGNSSTDSAIVLTTRLNGNNLVLPWQSNRKPLVATPTFAKLRHDGESLEFLKKDPAAALETYRQAFAAAHGLQENCEAQMLMGRALVKAGNLNEAAKTYRAQVNKCSSTITDDEGIPFSFYAAGRLIELGLDPPLAYAYLIQEAHASRWLQPIQARMIHSLLKSASGEEAEEARNRLADEIEDIEKIKSFAKEFPPLSTRIEPSQWLPYGDEPWLFTITAEAAPLPGMVFVVASKRVAPPGTKLVSRQTPNSYLLGDEFPGLRLEWHPDRTFESRGLPLSLYLVAVTIVLGATTLTGCLLIRDVNRNMRMAEMRSHFVASVSHELRTPLTAIRMFAETLALGRSKDERTHSEYLDTIVNESERLTRLVDNVLDFSKIEQGKRIYRMRPVNLGDIVRAAARAMQYPLAQQGFKLNLSIDDVPALSVDPDAIEQAILNLLINAVKYSGGARQIELRAGFETGEAVIQVIDCGLGIAPEDRQRIFEKFYRVRSPETESIAGAGLGLTLVQHIAQAHRGRVELESTVGQGSTFSIRIPIVAMEGTA